MELEFSKITRALKLVSGVMGRSFSGSENQSFSGSEN
jgi:hypothetical protein